MPRRLPAVGVVRRTTFILAALLTVACARQDVVLPSAPASLARPLAVVEMLPTTLRGQALVEHPNIDSTTGALSRLVRRLGKTSADVEAAGRIAPGEGPSSASVQGVRIAGVDGGRLLAEEIALIREILGRERQGVVPTDAISLGGKDVTRFVGDHSLYVFVSRDTIFRVGAADDRAAEELIRQIP